MGPKRSRRDLLFALPVLVAIGIVAYIALSGTGSDGRDDGAGATAEGGAESSLRWELASRIANSQQEKGEPRGLAECVGERAAVSSTHEQLTRMWRDPEYLQTRTDVTEPACERSYVGPSSTPESGPITIDPQASPANFAAAVDAICAVDFNQALDQEAEIENAAPSRHWTPDEVESSVAAIWSGSQAETAQYVANLGTPPTSAEVVERWRENVAERGRMFGAKGKALAAGERAHAAQIDERMRSLKEEADRLGNSFGLRVCTSN
jgi:hypothetical protein